MPHSTISVVDELEVRRAPPNVNLEQPISPHPSAVSWGAILAGGTAAAALSLILLMLGTGLSLSSVSPWAYSGVTATTFGVSTILWLTFTQIAASGMGGYLAGRLRTKWLAVHTDEVYFRDTAHGLLAWAVASLATAALLTSVIGSIVNGGVQAGAAVAGGGAAAVGVELAKSNNEGEPMAYYVDSLFRKEFNTTQELSITGATLEVTRIFMHTLHTDTLPADDVQYISQIVAVRTGLSPQAAKKRVIETYARLQAKLHDMETAAKVAADKSRKASAYVALWLFISLLIGAFFASFAATIGGRQRDL